MAPRSHERVADLVDGRGDEVPAGRESARRADTRSGDRQ